MLMFWSKRTVLTRRLLKAKVRGEHETECEAQEDSSSRTFHRTSSSNTSGGAAAAGYDNNTASNNNTATTTTTGRQVSRVSGATEGGGAVVYASRNTSRLQQGCCGGGHVSQDDDEQQQQRQRDPGRLLRCKELLKTLKENQLEMLLTAVESSGADLGSCVLVPRQQRSAEDYPMYDQQHEQYHSRPHRHHGRHFQQHRYRRYRHRSSRHHRSSSVEDEQESYCSASEDSLSASPMRSDRCCVGGKASNGGSGVVVPVRGSTEGSSGAPSDPHLLCCQIWRWPDLEHSSELKRLPICHSAKDSVYICCNPYHWSRLCKLDGKIMVVNRSSRQFRLQEVWWLHSCLTNATEMMNSVYAVQLLLWISSMSFNTLTRIYTINDGGAMSLPLLIVREVMLVSACVTNLLIISIICHVTATQANRVGKIAFAPSSAILAKRSFMQDCNVEAVTYFQLQQVHYYALFGIIRIDLPLLLSKASGITTYLVILHNANI